MRCAFGDSFLFIALLNPRDSFHQRAVEVTRDWEGQIITTRWILAEVGNALCGVNARQSFATFLEGLADQAQVMVLPDSDSLFDQGIKLFSGRPDKEWSLTDCISFAAMRVCSLEEVLTGDHHFEQAGFRLLMR